MEMPQPGLRHFCFSAAVFPKPGPVRHAPPQSAPRRRYNSRHGGKVPAQDQAEGGEQYEERSTYKGPAAGSSGPGRPAGHPAAGVHRGTDGHGGNRCPRYRGNRRPGPRHTGKRPAPGGGFPGGWGGAPGFGRGAYRRRLPGGHHHQPLRLLDHHPGRPRYHQPAQHGPGHQPGQAAAVHGGGPPATPTAASTITPAAPSPAPALCRTCCRTITPSSARGTSP